MRLAFLYCEVQSVGVIDLAFVFSTSQRGKMCLRHVWRHKQIYDSERGKEGGGRKKSCLFTRAYKNTETHGQASNIHTHTQPLLLWRSTLSMETQRECIKKNTVAME